MPISKHADADAGPCGKYRRLAKTAIAGAQHQNDALVPAMRTATQAASAGHWTTCSSWHWPGALEDRADATRRPRLAATRAPCRPRRAAPLGKVSAHRRRDQGDAEGHQPNEGRGLRRMYCWTPVGETRQQHDRRGDRRRSAKPASRQRQSVFRQAAVQVACRFAMARNDKADRGAVIACHA